MINILNISIIILFISILFILISYIFYRYIYSSHKVRTADITFSDLLSILNVVINTELDLYEKNIFENKGSISNSNFDNYYNDIVSSIINSLSDDFFFRINFYIKQDAVVSIICRNVRNFLTSKINGLF